MVQIPVSDGRWRWLESTKQLQEDYYKFDFDALRADLDALADYMTWNHTAAVVELGEGMNEVGWKTWAKPRGWINREAFISEMVDVNHFIANMLVAAKCTDEEWERAYEKKQEINRQRQRDGYDSVSTKCMMCHRALDDPAVNCSRRDQDMAWCEEKNGWYSQSLQHMLREKGETEDGA